MNLVEKITKSQIRTDLPEFRVGDTVRVDLKITEKDSKGNEKVRIQAFEGLVMAIQGVLIVFFAYFLDKAKVACRYLYSIFKFRGTYCIFALFFGSDFLDEIVEKFAVF